MMNEVGMGGQRWDGGVEGVGWMYFDEVAVGVGLYGGRDRGVSRGGVGKGKVGFSKV